MTENPIGNVLMFIPAGIYIMQYRAGYSKRNAFYKVKLCSAFIEMVQYIFVISSTNIDDVLLNGLEEQSESVFLLPFSKFLRTKKKLKRPLRFSLS